MRAARAEKVIASYRGRLLQRGNETFVTAETHGTVTAAARSAAYSPPAGMLDSLEKHWTASGIADRLHTERFRQAVITTGEGGTVTFSGSGTTVEADGDRSLLETGEAAGVLMPSGCRMGICFGCVAPLRRGAVRDLRNGDLTTAADGDGVVIQTCISAAAGDCDIDL